jgi:integrase
MARGIHRLTAADLRRNKLGDHADGGGLYLQITRSVDRERLNRSWVFRYKIDGRDRYMGLGSATTVSLAEAREQALQCRKQRLGGLDPIEERKAQRAAKVAAVAKLMSFDECAAAYNAARRASWRNERHAQQWPRTIARYVSPVFGKLPVGDVDTALVVKALRPVWERVPDTAARLRGRLEAILDWATVSGFRQGENPARWSGHLEHIFATPRKLRGEHHLAAMPFRDVPAFMHKLRALEGTTARALEFAILVAARSGEARGLTYAAVDLTNKVATIAGSRMKSGRPHTFPLAPRVLEIIASQQATRRSDLVFPGRDDGVLHHSAFAYTLRRLGADAFTPHGFRSAFRDWAGEITAFPREVAEAALAHRVGNAVELAYRRGDALEKRRALMNAWAEYCNRPAPTDATVTPLRRRVGR